MLYSYPWVNLICRSRKGRSHTYTVRKKKQKDTAKCRRQDRHTDKNHTGAQYIRKCKVMHHKWHCNNLLVQCKAGSRKRTQMQKGDRSKQALFWTTCALVKTSDQIIAMKPSKDRRGKHKKRKLPLRGKTRN